MEKRQKITEMNEKKLIIMASGKRLYVKGKRHTVWDWPVQAMPMSM